MENRGWVHDPTKESEEYIRGVNEFLEFVFKNSEENGKILCPCITRYWVMKIPMMLKKSMSSQYTTQVKLLKKC